MPDNDFRPRDAFPWFAALLFMAVIATLVSFGLGAAGDIFGTAVHREVVEQSSQYAVTNTDAFYTRLEGVRKIDTEVAGIPPGDARIAALQSQRDLLVSELRREVAKIPPDARTADMLPYSAGR